MNVGSKTKTVSDSIRARAFKWSTILPILSALLICSLFGSSSVFAETKDEAINYNNMAVLKIKKGDYNGALKDLNDAIRVDPKYALAYSNRIVVKNATNDFEGAIADYEELTRVAPYVTYSGTRKTAARAYNRRGLIKYGQQDYLGAISDYDKAIKLDPTEPQYYKERALAKQKQGDYKGAAEDLFNVKQLQ